MLKYKLQEEKEHLTSAQIAKSVKNKSCLYPAADGRSEKMQALSPIPKARQTPVLPNLQMKLLCWIYTGQWREKSLCFILILIPTQSVEIY